jgi:hypothetical protein
MATRFDDEVVSLMINAYPIGGLLIALTIGIGALVSRCADRQAQ